jgi:alpha-galactosidase
MNHIRFDAGDTTLILSCGIGSPPRVLHWGRRLSADVSAATLEQLGTRQGCPGSADVSITESLALEPGLGLLGPPGFSAHRAGLDWGSLFVVVAAACTADRATISCHDARTRLRLDYEIMCGLDTGVLTIGSVVTNDGDAPLDLVEMATACLPIPQAATELIGFSGRWSGEFRRERFARFSGTYLRENRRGRASHDSFPAVILCTPSTNERLGDAYGLHLAWSGNHRIRVDTLTDGRVFTSLGALLLPGEIRLAAGEAYRSPDIVAAYSPHGLSALSQQFHRHVRTKILRPSTRAKVRPVHYNTWEAVYFDHDPDRLKTIALKASEMGVERFVLDDGWFGARRDDHAGLGDWTVSKAVYPDGLKPIVDYVTSLGMEMGIWFEPEMVNPDSDLYRAHPDWALQIEGVDQVPFRDQYVLDISRTEVADYLFGQIDAILTDHDIGYVKWDMNRDLNHPADVAGRGRAHAQVAALYALIDRIRAAHPEVEIETCSSGGARPDLGILAHTDRMWTSDSNDAIDRQSIQRGASFFLPLDVMGAHVGPGQCHQTGRRLSMNMRAGTAMIGHMGLELDLLSEPDGDLATLKAAIAMHKEHRALLHNGEFYRLDMPDYLNGVGVVAPDRSEALFSVAQLRGHDTTLPDRLCAKGLDADAHYRVHLMWPLGWHSQSSPSISDALDLTGVGAVLPGDALMTVGMQLPLAVPETVLLFHFERQVGPRD